MRNANIISSSVLLVFSLALLFWLIPWQVEETFDGQVSPRLLPQICAIGIGLLSAVMLFSNLFGADSKPKTDDAPPITRVEARAMFAIGGLLGLGILLFTWVGPLIACAVLIVGIMVVMGERRPLPIILIPSVLLGGAYVLFYEVLGTAIL
ncbi:MAG: tripartite tricarboxylate transporter TctB family protein [Chromatiales bacterium]|nr:tripartite tricarboxylate transporter TctB family protein [Chromatiales bacterium]